MRTPSHRRSQRRPACAVPDGVDLAELAGRVTYIGSQEHKRYPSPAGPPNLRSDATPCDHTIGSFEDFEMWLRAGMVDHRIGGPWMGAGPGYPNTDDVDSVADHFGVSAIVIAHQIENQLAAA